MGTGGALVAASRLAPRASAMAPAPRVAVAAVAALVVLVGCGGGAAPPTSAGPTPGKTATSTSEPATDVPGTDATGAQLCSLLGAEDFGAFGYVMAAEPSVSSDGPGNAYCVYAGERHRRHVGRDRRAQGQAHVHGVATDER